MRKPDSHETLATELPVAAASEGVHRLFGEGERRLGQSRHLVGIGVAPALFLLLWLAPIPGLNEAAQRLLAILGVVVTLWVTEAIPLPVTALLGPALCVLAGLAPARDVFKSFADPIIFLFLGSFLLAEAIFHHGLNRRIAFRILSLKSVGESPARLLLAFGCITGFISMWISNTTATAMMFPVGMSILKEMARRRSLQLGRDVKPAELQFSTALMLMTAFSAAVGGFATPVGAAPNLIGMGMIQKSTNCHLHFFKWVAFGVPLSLLLLGFLAFYFIRASAAAPDLLQGSSAWIQAEQRKLGGWTRGEKNVLAVFGLTVALWLLPGILALTYGAASPASQWMDARLPESMAALLGAILLFLMPVDLRKRQFTLGWHEARRIDWGTILLFGGGMALGGLMFSTGLADWIGHGLATALNASTTFGLVVLFTFISATVTQVTSNTAAATMSIPVAIAVANAAGVNPVQPALAACLASGLGCMLPVSTPPNAIVYGSGCIPVLQMVKHGFVIMVVGAIAIIAVVMWIVPSVL